MKFEFFSKAEDFLTRTKFELERDEFRHGLMLGLATRLIENPHAYGETAPWFCLVSDGRKLMAASLRTPPYPVLLAHFSGDASSCARLLADSISEFSKTIPGARGEKEITDNFVKYWCATHNIKVEGMIAQRVYKLEHLNDIELSDGRLRLASEKDKELIIKWAHAFHTDVFASSHINEPEDNIVPKIDEKLVYISEDKMPVSMAAKIRQSNNGMRIGSVYTPDPLRGKGYATSCVATLCKEILDSGYKYCVLYADLANPVSNSIYQKIGFKGVGDSVDYSFSKPQEQ